MRRVLTSEASMTAGFVVGRRAPDTGSWTYPVPPPPPQAPEACTKLPLASICTQRPLVSVPVVVANVVVFPDRLPEDGATPAPPPMTGTFAVRAPEEASMPVAV